MVDLLEDEEDLKNEQAALDDHDDRVTGLFDHLVNHVTLEEQVEKSKPDPRQSPHRRLLPLEGKL